MPSPSYRLIWGRVVALFLIKPAELTLALSRVHPLAYLLLYLAAIPAFAFLYVFVTPHEFYAPHARFEPGAHLDTIQLASSLEAALHRSFNTRSGREFIVGNWKFDINSLRVDDVKSADGTQLSFRVRLSANGIGELTGAKTLGWAIVATVKDRPTSVRFNGPNDIITYRFPDADFSTYASPFKEENTALFEIIFGQGDIGYGALAPALALDRQEELQFQRYLRGMKGDASSISDHFSRMAYLSSVVITTLGLGDIIPITAQARFLVALEAVSGIVFAGLFLNALAYRASKSNE